MEGWGDVSVFQGISSQIYHFRASQGISNRYSRRFPVRCIISMHLRSFPYNIENTYMGIFWKIHMGKFLENTYRGFFSEYVLGEFPVYDREGGFWKIHIWGFFGMI